MSGAKIISVLGARPQFIKAATISRALAEQPALSEVIVHTGQHFDPEMSGDFFRELDLPEPAHNLGIQGGGHGGHDRRDDGGAGADLSGGTTRSGPDLR